METQGHCCLPELSQAQSEGMFVISGLSSLVVDHPRTESA